MLLSNDKRNEQLTSYFNSPTATAAVTTEDPVSLEAAKPMLPGARVDLRSGIQGSFDSTLFDAYGECQVREIGGQWVHAALYRHKQMGFVALWFEAASVFKGLDGSYELDGDVLTVMVNSQRYKLDTKPARR